MGAGAELREFLDINMKAHHKYNISNFHIEIGVGRKLNFSFRLQSQDDCIIIE